MFGQTEFDNYGDWFNSIDDATKQKFMTPAKWKQYQAGNFKVTSVVDLVGKKLELKEVAEVMKNKPIETAIENKTQPETIDNKIKNGEAKLIGQGNTGNVYLLDNDVYKNKKDNEVMAYNVTTDLEGVIKAQEKDGYLKTKYYNVTMTEDDFINAKASKKDQLASILNDNRIFVQKTISDISNKGISYSDSLQFVYDKEDRKVKLFDFSNAIIDPKQKADFVDRNFGLLSRYYNSAGLTEQAKRVSDARLFYKSGLSDSGWLLNDETVKAVKSNSNIEEISNTITKTLGESKSRFIYFQRDARDISFEKKYVSIESDTKGKYIITNEKLDFKKYELDPMMEIK
jgi:hypothetical protein